MVVKVKDQAGKVVSKVIKSYTVKGKFALSSVKVSTGKSNLKFNIKTKNGIGKVRFKYVLKYNGEIVKNTSYKSSSSFTIKNAKSGNYKLTVYAKEMSTGKKVKKTISYKY